MPGSFLIRWSLRASKGGPAEGEIDFQITNACGHTVYVNAVLWPHQGDWRQLGLIDAPGLLSRFGLPFRLEAYQAAACRAKFDQDLIDALRSGAPVQVFLAHLGWPQEARPSESVWLDGGLVDQAALDELKP